MAFYALYFALLSVKMCLIHHSGINSARHLAAFSVRKHTICNKCMHKADHLRMSLQTFHQEEWGLVFLAFTFYFLSKITNYSFNISIFKYKDMQI